MSHKETVAASKTPAKEDKHLFTTLLFAAVVVTNHKLGWQLSPGELGILGTVFGAFMAQSQLAAWARLQALLGSPKAPDAPPPTSPA